MTRSGFLDPRFALALGFSDQAMTNVEREAGRQAAETIARGCGYTFDEALAELRKPAGMREPAEPTPLPTANVEPLHPSYPSTERDKTIVEALAADPSASDRSLARMLRCSPTTVGRARAAAGLARQVRRVRRGSQAFEMALSRRARNIALDARPFD